jgi:hypothetical protein
MNVKDRKDSTKEQLILIVFAGCLEAVIVLFGVLLTILF